MKRDFFFPFLFLKISFISLLQAVSQTNLVLAKRRTEEEHMLHMLVEKEEVRPHVDSVAGRRVIN